MIKPIGDKLVVELEDRDRVTASGIITRTDDQDSVTSFGKVIALGTSEFPFEVGETVVFDKYAGTNVKVNGKECLVLNEFQIIAVLKE